MIAGWAESIIKKNGFMDGLGHNSMVSIRNVSFLKSKMGDRSIDSTDFYVIPNLMIERIKSVY